MELTQGESAVIVVGPILDISGLPYGTDDLTPADFRISKADGTLASLSEGAAVVIRSAYNGTFAVTVPAADLDTLGAFWIEAHKDGYCSPLHGFMVVLAIGGATISAEQIQDIADAVVAGGAGGLTEEQAAELTAIKAKTDTITAGRVSVVSPVLAGGDLEIVAGRVYDGNHTPVSFTWITGTTMPDSIVLRIRRRNDKTTALDITGTIDGLSATFAMTAQQTGDLSIGHSYEYQLIGLVGDETINSDGEGGGGMGKGGVVVV